MASSVERLDGYLMMVLRTACFPRVRLLNNIEYNNTVAALLGDTMRPANAFPASTPQLGFINNADQAVGAVHAAALDEAAATLAAKAARDLSRTRQLFAAHGETPGQRWLVPARAGGNLWQRAPPRAAKTYTQKG